MRGIVDEDEPLDDVALDGVGESWTALVRSARPKSMMAVARALEVRIAPEKIGGVEVVVGPERRSAGRAGQARSGRARAGRAPARRRRERPDGERATGVRRSSAPWRQIGSSAAKMVKLATSGRGLAGRAEKSCAARWRRARACAGGARVGRGKERASRRSLLR
jgi:hypothetical protein